MPASPPDEKKIRQKAETETDVTVVIEKTVGPRGHKASKRGAISLDELWSGDGATKRAEGRRQPASQGVAS